MSNIPPQRHRRRTVRIHIDSRDAVEHKNNNPSEYTYTLKKAIPNAVSARLVRHKTPYSPTHLVVVTNSALVRPEASSLVTSIAGTPETSSAVATWTLSTTVNLKVFDVHTIDRDSGSTKINVFVCTGTVDTNTLTGWTLTNRVNNSTIVGVTVEVITIEESPQLYIDFGHVVGRLKATRSIVPLWQGRWYYRVGDRVTNSGTQYYCTSNHFSTDFSSDNTDGKWAQSTASVIDYATSNEHFMVLDPTDQNETTLTGDDNDNVQYEIGHQELRSIDIRWTGRSGSHYIFPYDIGETYSTYPSTLSYDRQFKNHVLILEVEYDEVSNVPINRPQGTIGEPHFTTGDIFTHPTYKRY